MDSWLAADRWRDQPRPAEVAAMPKNRGRGMQTDAIVSRHYELTRTATKQLDMLAMHFDKTRRAILSELIDQEYNRVAAIIERQLTTLRR